jgi:type IV pilus assembly protein PilY1
MKQFMNKYTAARSQLLISIALASSLAFPMPSLAASVTLASSPLAVSTTHIVKPNITFLLDNSGSMAWEHMPDDATDQGSAVTFSYGYYGLRSSQCNQAYYNPNITYDPPVYPNETPYANAIFTGALPSGYQAAGTTIVSAANDQNYTNTAVNLVNSFKAHLPASYTTMAGDTFAQGAYYYSYSGAQTTLAQKDYNSTTNAFYLECKDSTGGSVAAIAPVNGVKALVGGAPTTAGSGVFTKVRLSNAQTTTLTLSGTGGGNTSASVSGITVNGVQIMSAASATSNNISSSTMATNIAAQINLRTPTTGISAAVAGSTITITSSAAAAIYASSVANFPPVVTSITGNLGTIKVIPDVFPDTDATHLTNFANWYSFYRTRMLMMKTAAGRAFSKLNKDYRVGLIKLSASSSPVVFVDTFWDNAVLADGPLSTQRTTWYNTLYAMQAGGSTPLREALSNTGRYYAHLLAGADPMQYSCQQNFTILSTDGYWNGNAGFKTNGSTAVGNQDGTEKRPMNDGAQTVTTTVTTYSRNSYSTVNSGCTSPQIKLMTQPQYGTCSLSTATGATEVCNWVNGPGPYAVGSTSYGSCSSSVVIPIPNPSARVQIGTAVTTSGSVAGTSDMLADVALYYYNTDLRTPALGNCTSGSGGATLCSTPAVTVPPTPDPYNNVFISNTDSNTQQHMTTFTLGMGASGKMRYSKSYLTDTDGDYVAVKLGLKASTTVCPWQTAGTTCNWPVPGMSGGDGLITNIDDMWHAAVNGRGAYFAATDPTSLADGLSNALFSISAKKGAAAAAATSTLNPVAGNNYAYVASYTTVKWTGNLEARGINVNNAKVNENASWCVQDVAAGVCAAPGTVVADTSGSTTAYNCVTPNTTICTNGTQVGTDCLIPVATACTGTMNGLVSDLSDTRTIKTAKNISGVTTLTDFDTVYAAANPSYFDAAHISTLSQWVTLTTAQKTAAAGANLVNYLRGQYGYDNRGSNAVANWLYRYREATLGDALESQPAFISKPVFSYTYPGYSTYVTAQANRPGTVFMGTNDGMMHAFAADTGVERWAYVPSMVIPNMWRLADMDYSSSGNHVNYVNGSPITSDVYCTGNCGGVTDVTFGDSASWRTILVAGLNGGGRGYFALDITVPATPVLLWELTPTTGIGKVKDDDIGYSYGPPVITRKADGTWVVLVTSGYDNGTLSGNPLVNNSPAGSGIGYLYVLDAITGTRISKISTAVGSAATPSGLAKIAVWNDEPGGNKAGYVYGGDLQGNLWRFDINDPVTPATIGTGKAFKFATLLDAFGTAQPITTTPVLGSITNKRMIFIGTGQYLSTSDLSDPNKQTQYGIMDDEATSTLVNARSALVQQTFTDNLNGTRSVSNNAVDLTAVRGWYIDFPDKSLTNASERANIDAKLVSGTLLIPTIVPSSTDCSPGGWGWLNFVNYKTGGCLDASCLASEKFDATIVGFNIVYIQGEPQVLVVTSADPTPHEPPTPPPFTGSAGKFTGKRMIWRELIP